MINALASFPPTQEGLSVEASQINDRVESLVANCRAALTILIDTRPDQVEEARPGFAEYVAAFLDHVLVATGTGNPALISDELLASTTQWLQPIADNLNAVASAGHVNQLNDVRAYVDSTLAELAKWPSAEPTTDVLTAATATYRRSMGQQLAGIRTEIDAVMTKSDTASKNLVAKASEIEASISTLRTEHETLTEQVSATRQSNDTLTTELQSQFTASQGERDESFKKALEKFTEKYGTLESEKKTEADKLLEEMKAHLRQVEKMMKIITATGTAEAFSKEATEQREQAKVWRRFAVGLAIVGAIAAVFTSLIEADPAHVAARLAFSFTLLGIAGYAANQAGVHRRREEGARALELDLVAFDPFIRDLPEAQQMAVREQMIGKVFGRNNGNNHNGEINKDTISAFGAIIDHLTKFKG
jgi:hypothetical protein